MSIGSRLKQERARLRWTQGQMGELAGGVAKRTVIDWEHDATSPTARQLERLAAAGIDACYVVVGAPALAAAHQQVAQESAPQPCLPAQDAAAGAGDLLPVPRHPLSAAHGGPGPVLALGRQWMQAHQVGGASRLSAVRVVGDSMAPTLIDGDDVVIDELSVRPCEHDGAYVVTPNGGLRVRRIRRRIDGNMEVWVDHPRYPTEVVTAEMADAIRVVGRVVWPSL